MDLCRDQKFPCTSANVVCYFLQKRKASNADQSTSSSDLLPDARLAVANESLGESQRRNDERLSVPKSGNTSVDISSASKDAAPAAKQLPTGVSDAGHSSRDVPGETELPVKAVKESQRSDSVAVGAKNAATGSATGGAMVTNEKARNTVASSHESSGQNDPHDSADDHSAWETVEAKGRGNRNRRACYGQARSERSGAHNTPSQGSSSAAAGATGSKKGKKASGSRRRNNNGNSNRNANRKMVKEILSSVLDGVDAEVKRRRSQVAKSVGSRANLPARLPQATNGPRQGSAWQARPMTMRDVVLGRLRAEAENAASAKKQATARAPAKKEPVAGTGRPEKKGANTGHKGKNPLRNNPKGAWTADQSTAPTVPETLSGISANTQSSGITDVDNASMSCITSTERVAERNAAAVDYSSSGDIAVNASAEQHVKVDKKDTSPTPPLQTLPWPGNTNSASSSVASSLEVPHGRHLHHHHSSVANENDVGYHLLDVCDRLSRDMDVFMGRRAVALCIRRRERGALLAALQDTASVSFA